MKNKFWEDLELLNEIGKGSISTVYKAISKDGKIYAVKHISLPREQREVDVLLKNSIIKNATEANNYYAKTIRKEIEIMRKFNGNPYIIDYYDIIQNNSQDGRKIDFYIKLEYAEDINKYYFNKTIDTNEVLNLGIDICSALELCEKIDIIHNDIKPSNIFLGNDGIYKLGDFNISVKDNEEINGFGTPNYVSPEIYNKQPANKTTDLYSLGLVMYKLLNGDIAFKDDTNTEKDAFNIRMSGKKIPVIKDLNSEFMEVLLKACDFESSNRYNNATEMKAALMNVKSANTTDFETKKENFSNIKEMNETPMNIKNISTFDLKNNIENSANIELESTMDIYQQELIEEALIKTKKNKNTLYKLKSFFSDSSNYKKLAGVLIVITIVTLGIRTFTLNRSCDKGYINKNGTCVKGYYYCKDGYMLNEDNKCQKTIESKEAKVSLNCKTKEYVLKDGMCIKSETKTPQYKYKCIDGWELNGTKCEKTETTDAIPTDYICPSNDYKVLGTKCVIGSYENAKSEYYCRDSSYKLSGNKCQKNIIQTVNATINYYCDAGGTIDPNNKTICNYKTTPKYTLGRPSCDKGELSYQDWQCHYSVSAKEYYSCTEGQSDGKGKCRVSKLDIKNADINYTCPSTSQKYGAFCITSNSIDATVKYKCADGSTPNGSKCYSKIIIDAVGSYECEAGYYNSGNTCYKDDTHNAIKKYSCSRVYTLNGDKCEKYDIIAAKARYNE